MSLKPLVLLPDPILRQVSRPVEHFDAKLRGFASDMLDTMYDAPGIGLAAIQVGEPIRLLVIDLAKEDEPKNPQIFINPVIVTRSNERSVYEEGCLSIPDYYAEVERPARVGVDYVDEHGSRSHIEAEGLLATCLQHEIDHLDGILFIDHISALKRNMILRKLLKARKEKEREAAEGKSESKAPAKAEEPTPVL